MVEDLLDTWSVDFLEKLVKTGRVKMHIKKANVVLSQNMDTATK